MVVNGKKIHFQSKCCERLTVREPAELGVYLRTNRASGCVWAQALKQTLSQSRGFLMIPNDDHLNVCMYVMCKLWLGMECHQAILYICTCTCNLSFIDKLLIIVELDYFIISLFVQDQAQLLIALLNGYRKEYDDVIIIQSYTNTSIRVIPTLILILILDQDSIMLTLLLFHHILYTNNSNTDTTPSCVVLKYVTFFSPDKLNVE